MSSSAGENAQNHRNIYFGRDLQGHLETSKITSGWCKASQECLWLCSVPSFLPIKRRMQREKRWVEEAAALQDIRLITYRNMSMPRLMGNHKQHCKKH